MSDSSTTAPGANDAPPDDTTWWHTASAAELRPAADVVCAFLRAADAASEPEIEAFARALALSQLLGDGSAVRDAVSAACMAIPDPPPASTSPDVRADVGAWLQRGRSTEAGLCRATTLLGHSVGPEFQGLVRAYQMKLQIHASLSVSATVHGGLEAPVKVLKPVRFRV